MRKIFAYLFFFFFLTSCIANTKMSLSSSYKDEFILNKSKIIPNLFFAGETLNIDAVTGGFNFQAAWTTGFIAGNNIAQKNCI